MKKKVLFALIALFSFVGAWAQVDVVINTDYTVTLDKKWMVAGEAAPEVVKVNDATTGFSILGVYDADKTTEVDVSSFVEGQMGNFYLKVAYAGKSLYVPFKLVKVADPALYNIVCDEDSWNASYENGGLKNYYSHFDGQGKHYDYGWWHGNNFNLFTRMWEGENMQSPWAQNFERSWLTAVNCIDRSWPERTQDYNAGALKTDPYTTGYTDQDPERAPDADAGVYQDLAEARQADPGAPLMSDTWKKEGYPWVVFYCGENEENAHTFGFEYKKVIVNEDTEEEEVVAQGYDDVSGNSISGEKRFMTVSGLFKDLDYPLALPVDNITGAIASSWMDLQDNVFEYNEIDSGDDEDYDPLRYTFVNTKIYELPLGDDLAPVVESYKLVVSQYGESVIYNGTATQPEISVMRETYEGEVKVGEENLDEEDYWIDYYLDEDCTKKLTKFHVTDPATDTDPAEVFYYKVKYYNGETSESEESTVGSFAVTRNELQMRLAKATIDYGQTLIPSYYIDGYAPGDSKQNVTIYGVGEIDPYYDTSTLKWMYTIDEQPLRALTRRPTSTLDPDVATTYYENYDVRLVTNAELTIIPNKNTKIEIGKEDPDPENPEEVVFTPFGDNVPYPVYDGSEHKPAYRVYFWDKGTNEYEEVPQFIDGKKQYDVAYGNDDHDNINATDNTFVTRRGGIVTVTFTEVGLTHFTNTNGLSTLEAEFPIGQRDITEDGFVFAVAEADNETYDGSIKTAEVATHTWAGLKNVDGTEAADKNLTEGDFTVAAAEGDDVDNINASVGMQWNDDEEKWEVLPIVGAPKYPFVTVTGIGNYKNSTKVRFDIYPKDITSDDIEIAGIDDDEYNSEEKTPALTITDGGLLNPDGSEAENKVIAEGAANAYTVEYTNNVDANMTATKDGDVWVFAVNPDAAKPTATVTGVHNYYNTTDKYFNIKPRNINEQEVVVTDEQGGEYEFTGDAITPELTVKDTPVQAVLTLVEGEDYIVTATEGKDNTNVGEGSVTITGINNYYDTRDQDFDTNPSEDGYLIAAVDSWKNYGTADPAFDFTITLGDEVIKAAGDPVPAGFEGITVTRKIRAGQTQLDSHTGVYEEVLVVNAPEVIGNYYTETEDGDFEIRKVTLHVQPVITNETDPAYGDALVLDVAEYTDETTSESGLTNSDNFATVKAQFIEGVTYLVNGEVYNPATPVPSGDYTLSATSTLAPSDYILQWHNKGITITPVEFAIVGAKAQEGNYPDAVDGAYLVPAEGETWDWVDLVPSATTVEYTGEIPAGYTLADLVKLSCDVTKAGTNVGAIKISVADDAPADVTVVIPEGANGDLIIEPLHEMHLDYAKVAQALEDNQGYTMDKVYMPNRNLKNKNWYTMVLPFDILAEDLFDKAKLGYGAFETQDLDNTRANDVRFGLTIEEVKANTPFILKVYHDFSQAEDVTAYPDDDNKYLGQVYFENKKIAEITAEGQSYKGEVWTQDNHGEGTKFIGTYTGKKGIADNERWMTTLAGVRGFYAGTSNTNIAATHAYLQFPSAEAATRATIYIEELDGTTTEIQGIGVAESDEDAAEIAAGATSKGWYTITGIKLDAEPTTSGTYIYNGQKVYIQK